MMAMAHCAIQAETVEALEVGDYQASLRRLFNQGENAQLLGDACALFDASACAPHAQSPRHFDEWQEAVGENIWSLFLASDRSARDLQAGFVQRAGICLIESDLTRLMWQRYSRGERFSEEEALACMARYPTESQLPGWKPVLNIPTVVFFEDVLCEERWNTFTGGAFSQSPVLRAAFQDQMERTEQVLRRWARLVQGGREPQVRFVRFSQIWEPLQEATREWLREMGVERLLEESAGEHSMSLKLASILYTYTGPRLAELAGVPGSRIVLSRQLSHLRNNPGWVRSPNPGVREFDAAVKQYCRFRPTPVAGYLDLLAGSGRMAHEDTRQEAKYHRGADLYPLLSGAIARPFPLAGNPIFHRGILLDFIPGIRELVLEAMELDRLRPRGSAVARAECRKVFEPVLRRMLEAYLEIMEALFNG